MKRAVVIFALVSTVAGVASAQMLRSPPSAPRAPVETAGGIPMKATAEVLAPARPEAVRHETAQVQVMPGLVTRQAPVPMVLSRRPSAFVPASGQEPASDTAPDTTIAATAVHSLAENYARAAIEADGYKNVRVVSKTTDGTWRARALRGTTEVSLIVDARGNVIGE